MLNTMRREITSTQPTKETCSTAEADRLRLERFEDGKKVFNDPVAYLRSLGIEAELVDETALSLVPAA